MCLILLSINQHPQYKLIVAANRDEFYERKTAPAAFWQDQPDVLGGRDLEAMGTWMGMTRSGRIAMVTNYRDLKNIRQGVPSRGKLVSDFLTGSTGPEAYLKDVAARGDAYNGFNLLVGAGEKLWYYSNYRNDLTKIGDGLHGLSNHLMDTPWPKIRKGLHAFESLLKNHQAGPDKFLDMLYDDEQASDAELPDTGVGLERERVLSSMFIKSPDYGSRCSTVVMVDHDDRVLFSERVYQPGTFDYETRSYEFEIERSNATS